MLLSPAYARRPSSPRSGQHWVAVLLFFGLITVLPGLSAEEDVVPRREFSAHLLMRMSKEKSGVGAQLYVKQDNLYIDYPDLVNKRRIPFWFLSNGQVATVKAAQDESFNPGPANPMVAGMLLRFHSTDADHFCEEFRSYSIKIMKAGGELGEEDLRNLQNPKNFPCEQTGHETVAGRDCFTYRAAAFIVGAEGWMTLSFDPKLAAILHIEINPPQGLILLLDTIKEGPQPASLFVPAPDHVVLMDLKN